jgi:hypothetical protein
MKAISIVKIKIANISVAFIALCPNPDGSSIVCKICKVPSSYITTCGARIYYVFGKDNMIFVCVHLGLHEHPVKAGEYQEFKEKTCTFIREHVERTPQATNSTIVLEATKGLLGELLLRPEGALEKTFNLEVLMHVCQVFKAR